MQKTTVYVPDEFKRSLTRAAAARGCSEPLRPRLPLFESRKPRLAERVDEALAGFGSS